MSDSTTIQRWADHHQYDQESFDDGMYDPKTGVMPRVHLVWMTPDPLGAIATACRMYEGKGTTDLSQITDEERRSYWQDAQATHLKAPLEFVNFHFFIEGVDRAFTHQHVRQRTAVFAQESMRFAVVDDLTHRTTLPPSLYGTEPVEGLPRGQAEGNRKMWDDTIKRIQEAYDFLVNNGMPAEEARGLLPHATATRLNYHTNLRNLLDHSGNRLCTQAQFHWRLVFSQIARAIRDYPMKEARRSWEEQTGGHPDDMPLDHDEIPGAWQFQELANIFKPVCYQLGHCPFKASFDRSCSIRDRVEGFAEKGVPSSQWEKGWDNGEFNTHGEPSEQIDPIHDSEWLMDPAAARKVAQ